MKRRLLKLGLLLLLGAIINVAVAWGCVIWSPKTQTEFIPLRDDSLFWRNEVSSKGLDRDSYVMLFRILGVGFTTRATTCILMGNYEERFDFGSASQTTAGFPIRSMRGSLVVTRTRTELQCVSNDAIPWSHTNFKWNRPALGLPGTPIWPGFAINTLFYAAILWLLFFAPFKLRRWRRLRRGLCPACAYPVGTWGGDKCTECGDTVRKE